MNIGIFISLIIGFTVAYFFNYKPNRTGYKLQELVLLMKGDCYHIHHFMFLGVIILAILYGRFMKPVYITITIAFLIGLSLEDLLFKDWYLIKNNCHKSKLMKFMMNTVDVQE